MDYISEMIKVEEDGIYLFFGITKEKQLKLLHFSSKSMEGLDESEMFLKEGFQLAQVSFSGYNRPYEKHGNKHIVTAPGYLLTYAGMEDCVNETGRKLTFFQEDKEVTQVRVETVMQFYNGTSMVRMFSKVMNEGEEVQTLEYISSFCYTGIEKEGKGILIRPTKDCGVKRFSGSEAQLEEMFQLGWQDMEDRREEILSFLGINKQ